MNAVLSEMVAVKGRFHRSVQLVKDYKDAEHLEGYILTPNGQSLTERILKGLSQAGQPRTWSITGPYGSGKSSFALFLADTLASAFPRTSMGQAIRSRTGFHLAPFFPLLLVGQRRNLHLTLKEAIVQTVTAEFPELEAKLSHWHSPDVRVVELLETVTQHLSLRSRGGLLLILDEFGKFLEYAAQNPDTEDLFLMQELAEFASRSLFPVCLITVLHTGFSDYLMHADHTARAEWQKVQGRFTDVNFQEPAEQFLQLIASAVDFRTTPEISKAYARRVREVLDSGALDEARKRIPGLDSHLLKSVPIEPITALLLWPLFRSKLAQNERSLFAFLTGSEPFGLLDFLTSQDTDTGTPMYSLSHLYQYVVNTLGSAAYQSDLSRRWSQIEVACDRLGQHASPLLRQVVQAIGLISSYGSQVGLKATRETLMAACGEEAEVDQALLELKNKSLVIFRNFEQTYALWDGSDVDLEEEFTKVIEKQGQLSLSRALQKHLDLYPQMARAHYIRTGNLRSFEVTIFEGRSTELSTQVSKLKPDHLQIIFVLSSTDSERKQLQLVAQYHEKNTNVIFAFPRPVVGLEGILRELTAWETIRRTSTALEGDPVAKKELEGRIQQTQQRLENVIGALFGVKGYRFDPSRSEWFHAGNLHTPSTARQFQQWLSQILDHMYPLAPVIRNELLNRNQLSSQSAKARRNLLEAMLLRHHLPRLGMEGFPPEYSMYAAVLKKGGFHQELNGQWAFTEPEGSYRAVWQAMIELLKERQTARVPLTELFELLRLPPFGIAEGPIPVLVSALLIHLRERVAIFDEGLFVPELRIETLERLVRRPDLFEVQWIEFTDETLQALQDMHEAIRIYGGKTETGSTPLLMDVVKPLILVAARLPAYSKYTRKLEPASAVLLRDMLLRIKDPVQLVTQDILALHHSTLEGESHPKSLSSWLLDCLNAMGSAYASLLYQIEEQVREAFQITGTSEEMREGLRKRAGQLRGYTVDQTLTAFVQQLSSATSEQWREQVGRVVHSGKPVTDWRDGDLMAFQVKLRQIASDFQRLEELVREKVDAEQDAGVQVIRISMLGQDLKEDRKVFSLREDQRQDAELLSNELLKQFRTQAKGQDPNVLYSALALLTRKIIGGHHE
ncbi:hypothetical protein [Deinococcus cellulosilyticus]|uniref:ATP-binding protein n=1 Tax=Deinococcus cellulosilyticus (strain DSM 18568 / NBRC 106333 / KACC 11606 / 5516J-15) TaxID=1223518 RepID=A0A511N8L9_DEIC1|nr:hypothetical protein [Deinococcus cellulosilyticus]GEM49189.1 hypothetical protein DC3_48240 [Deinococcus cellulosilyticus NBRC 106333 = KACC 11606]